jgi:hypothetical protein
MKEARNLRQDAHLDAGALMELQVTAPLDVRSACPTQLRARTSTVPSRRPM